MFEWLKRLFGRTAVATPPEPEPKPRPEPGPDIVARQGGQKRNRVHLYRQPFGYPIRACDWSAVSLDELESLADDPRDPLAAVTCRHCQAVILGKRASIGNVPNLDKIGAAVEELKQGADA